MIVIFLLLSLSTVYGQDWELVWHDDFDGEEINQSNWQWEVTAWGGGNNEFQVYTPGAENSWVQDGKLYIRPTLLENNINPLTNETFGENFRYNSTLNLTETYGICTSSEESDCVRTGGNINPVASARLRSFERFAFRYGRVEVRAKMPVGDWIWPAIWLLPENWCYGDWPLSGEMDIVESIGNEAYFWSDGFPAGIQKMSSAMHWGVTDEENRYFLTKYHHDNEGNDYGNMHDYAMEWSPNGVSYFIDGINHLNVPNPLIDEDDSWEGFFEFGKPWNGNPSNPWENANNNLTSPFDTQFHFLINVAVGGTNGYFSDSAINRGGDPDYTKPWINDQDQIPAMNQFYVSRGQDDSSGWLWTWLNGRDTDNDCMQVEYIRVYKHSGLPEEEDCPTQKYY